MILPMRGTISSASEYSFTTYIVALRALSVKFGFNF